MDAGAIMSPRLHSRSGDSVQGPLRAINEGGRTVVARLNSALGILAAGDEACRAAGGEVREPKIVLGVIVASVCRVAIEI